MLACDCNPSLHYCIVPKKKRNDAEADTIYKATEDINEEAIEVPQPKQLPHLLIPTLLWDKIVSGVDWNIVNYCLGKLGKGGYNILSEKCDKPFKE